MGEGEHVVVEAVEAAEEEDGAHTGLAVGIGVEAEAEETAKENPYAWHGILRRGFKMVRTAVWAVVGGVGGVIGRIAYAPFGRVETAGKTCPVR